MPELSSQDDSCAVLEREDHHGSGKLTRRASADAALALHAPSFGRRHQGPRRAVTEMIVGTPIEQQPSFKADFQHAASETYLITQLSFKLLSYLGVGYRWVCKLMALGLYALFLMPGFIQIGWYYFTSPCVHRSIVYGDQPRNRYLFRSTLKICCQQRFALSRLDLYLPEILDKPKPAVAFVTGGAWIIGYKAWGSLLAKRLVERDVIVACIDYRNFPQGTISDMVEDVGNALSFFCNNIASFGGDPNRLFLAGQSAGAHLSSCALIIQAKKQKLNGRSRVMWTPSQFKMFFGISGGYNLLELVDHFHQRGLYKSIFLSVMEGEESLPRFSPELVVKRKDFQPWIHLLPPAMLFHGTADYSIPYHATVRFADSLRAAGVKVTTKLFPHKTHTDLFLQDPMRGGRDELLEHIVALIYEGEDVPESVVSEQLVPEILLQLARLVSPF
ncbi:probable isoprenylcysteine alpha-carbonyl methylesterase ICMEL2 isoform X2 [Selaginella moellendorffii]|nr:probable isoprenylcysteine alpha-carbonyl methylesterase ICMEL2 isoform X2 [Selaginella moellendorffii]|eukprot:XP_024524026.1 probable isoprenylcysteine alpha-carbonyl methylesterase ICMEL2 isoform X2 [Selaginella moellendorffii]